ncbi:MAG TPA: phosphatase PAP2 family protein [Solirubrobacteraceae bacterium]
MRSQVSGALLAGLIVLITIGVGLGEISTHLTNAADLDAVRDLARERTGALTFIAHFLSVLGRTIVIAPLALVVAVLLGRSGRLVDAVLLIVSAVGALILYSAIKALVERPRPPIHHLEAASNWSFPSGHATTSSAFYLALALVLFAEYSVARGLAIAAAGLLFAGIGVSRVYLAVHYPADVVAGMLLGVLWCLFAYRVLQRAAQVAGRRRWSR